MNMNSLPDLSIITINYNGLKDSCELIESIRRHIFSYSYEIILVDNASEKNEAIILQEKYPFITAIRSEKNLGFSGGNNLGIRNAKGKYIFLLNNDTFVEEDSIEKLISRLNNPKIGGVSPKIKFAFPPHNIQFAGYKPLSKITLRNNLIGFGKEDNEQYNTPTRTPYCHGAAMIIKKDVIEKVGPMPEIYFLYYEELDWCTKIEKAGYELWYEPLSIVFHKESQSTGQESYLRTFYLTRNRLLYAWRNRTGIIKWLSIIYQLLIAFPKNTTEYLFKKRRKDLAKAVFNGTLAFFILNHKND